MLRFRFFYVSLIVFILFAGIMPSYSQSVEIKVVAHGLNNPRGIAVLPDGKLAVVEAGTGRDIPLQVEGSGQISIFDDLNGDGDYDDAGERVPLLTHQASYNSLPRFGTFHDEVFGLGDIFALDDGRLFYTKDEPFAKKVPNMPADTELYEGATGIYELKNGEGQQLVQRGATINGLVYVPQRELFYAVESGYNQLMSVNLQGEAKALIAFPGMGHLQQAVPSGLAYDPVHDDILVAAFSGFVHTYYGTDLSYMPGDSSIFRFDPDTRTMKEEITGLTTGIDVAVDEHGNIFVVEMTRDWPPALMPLDFDLYDPDAAPDPGGYGRFSGRVTMYPADGSAPRVLADGIDTPTNITYADGRLYVSAGLGTPGRKIWYKGEVHQIEGMIYEITGF